MNDPCRGIFGACVLIYIVPSIIAHTVSQRLRRLRKIPPELFPLGEYPTGTGLG
jgi:hypothetical protein